MVQRLIRVQVFRKDMQVQILPTAHGELAQWYSSCLEDNHSERISGFDSRAHRLLPYRSMVDHLALNQKMRVQFSLRLFCPRSSTEQSATLRTSASWGFKSLRGY